MSNYKLPKDIKNLMERELRQYYYNKKKLEILKKQFEKASPGGSRRLEYLEERLYYVENVYKRLKPFEQDVYNLIFKEQCNATYCQIIKNIDKTTYYNIFNKSIYYLAEEWGEI